jgi:hypothetical protein
MSYLRRVPAKDAVISTKRISPPDWTDAPDPGYFEILAFTRPEYVTDATMSATTRTTAPSNGRVTVTVVIAVFLKELFNSCLKGWGNLTDPDSGEAIPFTPENVAVLPDDAQGFLVEEILKAGRGVLSSRDIITKDEATGAPLDYKSPSSEVPEGDTQGLGNLPQ